MLGRFWGEGLSRAPLLRVNEAAFEWARDDAPGLRAAAQTLVKGGATDDNPRAAELMAILSRFDSPASADGRDPERRFAKQLLGLRPEALTEAIAILIARPEDVRTVQTRYAYTDADAIGGYLDQDYYRTRSERGR
jgi:hypothetical protein